MLLIYLLIYFIYTKKMENRFVKRRLERNLMPKRKLYNINKGLQGIKVFLIIQCLNIRILSKISPC